MNKKILKNILDTKIYLYTIIIIFSILISIPIVFQKVIIPSFKNQIVNNVLDESKRIAIHLSNSIDYINLNKDEIDLLMTRALQEFQIKKIHYFNKEGKILYSTIKEKIGTINTQSYFHEIVAKGDVYFKMTHKGDQSADNENVDTDNIEIYIPIMKKDNFHAAFELYYDVSKQLNEFNKLSKLIMKINIFICILASFLLYIIVYFISKKNLEIKKYQEKLKTMAHCDSLTNLYNRRYFYDLANPIISLSKRNDKPICVCMIDIDNFKNINDTYGHQIGDSVIKSLANKLCDFTRESDIVARYGGEEFIVLLPNTNIHGAKSIMQKICTHIEKLEFTLNNIQIQFTISIGISEYEKSQNIDEFIHQADNALYVAKNAGKNRVEIA